MVDVLQELFRVCLILSMNNAAVDGSLITPTKSSSSRFISTGELPIIYFARLITRSVGLHFSPFPHLPLDHLRSPVWGLSDSAGEFTAPDY